MITTGTILGRVEVREKVGEGGMATVYRGRHLTLETDVAIKVLHPHLASSEKNRTRFQREAHAIQKFTHDNILKIHDYSGTETEEAWIVTEFIDGPTLRELLDEVGAMMPEPAALIAWHLCRALQAAHDQKIIHRDLKPENVMIDRTGVVKLMDFGIARVLDADNVTMTGALVGSPAYMSPEQALDEEIDARSDLFSLGTVLYRMVTGTLPFRGSNPSIVLKAIIDGTYEDPSSRAPSLDHALASIICTLLARSPEDRFQSAKEVAGRLEAFLRSVGIDPEQPEPWSVRDYVTAPEEYEDQLAAILITTLTARGRKEAEDRRTADALHTFNRVLALDEDNTEVVEIIQAMRRPLPEEQGGFDTRWLWGAVLLILVGVGAALFGQTDGFTRWGATEPDVTIPALPLAPRLPVPVAEQAVQVVPVEDGPDGPAVVEADPTPEPTPRREPPGFLRPREPVEPPTPAPSERPGETAPPDPDPDEVVALVDEPPCEKPGQLHVENLLQQVRVDGGEAVYGPASFTLPPGPHEVQLVGTQFHKERTLRVTVCGEQPDRRITNDDVRMRPSVLLLEGFPGDATVRLDGRELGPVAAHQRIEVDRMGTILVEVWKDASSLGSFPVKRGQESGQLLPGQTRTLSPN